MVNALICVCHMADVSVAFCVCHKDSVQLELKLIDFFSLLLLWLFVLGQHLYFCSFFMGILVTIRFSTYNLAQTIQVFHH